MEKKNIFLDTSIFVNQCFCFDNKQLQTLIQLKEEGKLNLYITETIKEEVLNRIKYSIEQGKKVIKKDAHILGAHLNIDENNIIKNLQNKFSNYLEHFKIINLPTENIGNTIIKNYFGNKPPFDTSKEKKKQEFPDAFILETIKYWCNENNQNAIFISSDKDCKTFIDSFNKLSYEESLSKFLDKINKENNLFDTANKIYNDNLQDIELSLEKLIENIESFDYEIYYASTRDYQKGYMEPNFEIDNIDITEYPKIIEKELIDIDETSAYYNITISYKISAEFHSEDYSYAIYDDEDDKWYGVKNEYINKEYEIVIDNLDLTINLSNETFEIETEIKELKPVIKFYETID